MGKKISIGQKAAKTRLENEQIRERIEEAIKNKQITLKQVNEWLKDSGIEGIEETEAFFSPTGKLIFGIGLGVVVGMALYYVYTKLQSGEGLFSSEEDGMDNNVLTLTGTNN